MTSDQFMELVRSLGAIEGKLDQSLKGSAEYREQMDQRVSRIEAHVDELRISKAKVLGIGAAVSTIVTLIGWWVHG